MIRRLEVHYRDRARSDLDDIFWHIALSGGNPQTALSYVQRVEARCQRLADAPRSGRTRDDLLDGLRTVPFERSVLICYTVGEDRIWITNIFRHGRDVDAYFGRAPQTPGQP